MGSRWGGTEFFIRAQGAAVTKAILWWHGLCDQGIEVTWSGMTDDEKRDIAIWLKERSERFTDGLSRRLW